MGTVFGKNTTSTSITVAGHKVYYIDSTDAEIVEVEKTQPASIDVWLYLFGLGLPEMKTFSANDYWNSRVIDSTDEQTLRDFGVSLVNIDSDPIVYGIDSSNSDFSFAPLGLYSGLRTGDLNADMSNFYVADGDSTWSNRKCIWSRSAYSTPALTWKCRITKNSGGTSKYNAFKFTLNGTPYYYVIDGVHDTWTDDLSAWGYSEVQPVETLPTVTTEGDFASYNWLRVSSAESVSGGGNTSNLTTDGTDYPNYNTGNSYAILQWQQSGGTTSGRVEFSIVNANGKIQAHNNTSGALTFYQARVAVCSSSQAIVITVYDSSNNAYNAFKYTLSGTPYWYVIDGEHDTWTDDLSAWGYSEVPVGPVLPEVTFANDTSAGNWITPISGEVTNINAGSVVEGYYWTGSEYQPTTYNSSKVYAAIKWLTSGNVFAGRVEFQFVNYNGTIGVKNNTSGALTFNQAQLAACHSSDATVAIVYDSSNNAYNAFKYTANNTDYYYVLDGTQTDWTDDLAGIGYSLTPNYLKGYVNSSKSNSYVSRYSEKNLYDDAGNLIIGDSSKTYTIIGVYTANGGSVSYQNASLYAYDNRLKFAWNDSDAYIAYVEYTVL